MNLFELFFKIGVKDEASGEVKKLSDKLGKGLKASAKIGLSAVGAAAAGVAALTKQSLESYAEYEQLVGSVETLFGAGGKTLEEYARSVGKSTSEAAEEYGVLMKSQQTVLENADEAYISAGLSANEYMSTVTSFSASLLQSLDGDTQAAADLANQALIDMSDNANKMGTDMAMIQNAYQGFAKANYTMLDNLKLGYGGTQTEMKRLIRDAAVLDKSVDASSMSFANIVKAIKAVQDNMGITGTTAAEAATTIQGSANMAKAAWENLKIALADENGDVEAAADRFAESLGTLGERVLPKLKTILSSAAKVIRELAPMVIAEIPAIVSELAPELSNAAAGLVVSVFENLPGIVSTIPELGETAMSIISTLVDGITTAATDGNLAGSLITAVVEFARAITSPEALSSILRSGVDLTMGLVDGIIDGIPELIQAAPAIIGNLIGSLIDAAPRLATMGPELVFQLVEGLKSPENALAMLQGGVELIFGILEGVKSAFTYVFDIGGDIIGKFGEGFMSFLDDPLKWGEDLINKIIEGITGKWDELKDWWSGLWEGLFGGDKEVGVDIVATPEIDGSHRLGLSRVPYDGYIAELHEGERVLTKSEARAYGGGHGGVTVNVNIDGAKYSDEESLADAVVRKLQRLFDEEGAAYA